MKIKMGKISKFLKRARFPVLDLELWSSIILIIMLAVALLVSRAMGMVDWYVLIGN